MAKQPDPNPSLIARLERIEVWMRRRDSASPFFGTGVHPNGLQGLDSDNYVPATSGFRLDGGQGVAEFKDIVLYDLPNSMLANQVNPDSASIHVTNFAITAGTYTVLGSTTKTVPEGCTGLQVTASGWMFARNPNTTGGVDGTGTDAIFCYVRISASDGATDSAPYGQGISGFGGFTTATSGVSKFKGPLTPGETVTFSIYAASASQNLAADAQNDATLSASLLWFR